MPAALHLLKATAAAIVERAGILQLKLYHMESIKQNSLGNKAISPKQSTDRGGRAPTVKSDKLQAASNKHRSGSESVRILVNHWRWLETQGPSYKRQATSCKLQAISQVKRQAASD